VYDKIQPLLDIEAHSHALFAFYFLRFTNYIPVMGSGVQLPNPKDSGFVYHCNHRCSLQIAAKEEDIITKVPKIWKNTRKSTKEKIMCYFPTMSGSYADTDRNI
jgi:hypothetical protein